MQAGISGGESSEPRSAAVKMVFVKKESEEDTCEPEPWRIKQEEPETWRIKQEEPETWRIKQEEPESWSMKQEEQCLMEVKEEQDLNEVEENHQDQKAYDAAGETSVSCFKTENSCSQSSMEITEAKKPFTCYECGNAFIHRGYLKTHMKIHNRMKPFICPQCGKSFTQRGSLKNHVNSCWNEAFCLLSVWKKFRM